MHVCLQGYGAEFPCTQSENCWVSKVDDGLYPLTRRLLRLYALRPYHLVGEDVVVTDCHFANEVITPSALHANSGS